MSHLCPSPQCAASHAPNDAYGWSIYPNSFAPADTNSLGTLAVTLTDAQPEPVCGCSDSCPNCDCHPAFD